jgi:hypothetical protein
MSTRTARFEPVPWPASKNLPCPGCGKKVRRSKTFTMTLSPFNKNPDGSVRSRADIIEALREKAAAWQGEAEQCTPCYDKSREIEGADAKDRA